jgi:hypothetical protein
MHRHPPDLWIGCDIVAVDVDRSLQDFYILARRGGQTKSITYPPKHQLKKSNRFTMGPFSRHGNNPGQRENQQCQIEWKPPEQ